MKHDLHTTNRERGFTLVELLVVIVILGVLAGVATLAVTRFIGRGTLEAANSELEQARGAIQCCLTEAEIGQLDIAGPQEWDGSRDVITATSGGGTTYDAAAFLKGGYFKATYVVDQTGVITDVAANDWQDIHWEGDHWEK